jgi:hypothetical protein
MAKARQLSLNSLVANVRSSRPADNRVIYFGERPVVATSFASIWICRRTSSPRALTPSGADDRFIRTAVTDLKGCDDD